MNVNVSPVQLVSRDFVETVESALEEFGLDSSALGLEITEYVVVSDLERSRMTLRRLDRLGGPLRDRRLRDRVQLACASEIASGADTQDRQGVRAEPATQQE